MGEREGLYRLNGTVEMDEAFGAGKHLANEAGEAKTKRKSLLPSNLAMKAIHSF